MKYNIVFMGTPQFALPALKKLNKYHNVTSVICQPDRVNRRGNKVSYNPVKQYALEQSIDIFQPENINTPESEKFIKSQNPDFIIVVAYGQFISKNIREIPKEKIVNIHASLLPKYRGAAPIHRAIMNRDEITGVTIMEITKGMDEGDVFLEAITEIEDKNLSQLHDELSVIGSDLIIEYLKKYSQGSISPVPQDDSKATYAEKISKEDGFIEYSSVEKALGQIKGLYPRPGASIKYKDKRVRVLDGYIKTKKSDNNSPGEIISVDDQGMLVQFEDGQLMITEVQFPNNRPMLIKDYILGNNIDMSINLKE